MEDWRHALWPLSRRFRKVFAPEKPKHNLKPYAWRAVLFIYSSISKEVLFIQEVLGLYTSPFLDTDELKMDLRARKVSEAFEKRASGTWKRMYSVVAIDLTKAFDSICHNLPLAKLRAYCFQDSTIRFVRSYSSVRFQRVKCNGSSSDWLPVRCGVPQGSL